VDSIADNANAGGAVIATTRLGLSAIDGETPIARALLDGTGTEAVADPTVMHPVDSLLWLAGTLARAGQRLRAAQIVLTGALATSVALPDHGGRVTAEVAGLGAVEVHVRRRAG
jgi:2-keto-4-pentenoate hydratase